MEFESDARGDQGFSKRSPISRRRGKGRAQRRNPFFNFLREFHRRNQCCDAVTASVAGAKVWATMDKEAKLRYKVTRRGDLKKNIGGRKNQEQLREVPRNTENRNRGEREPCETQDRGEQAHVLCEEVNGDGGGVTITSVAEGTREASCGMFSRQEGFRND